MDPGKKILNEILNSDFRDLSESLEKHPEAVNILGDSGESPAHIAIYKNDMRMLQMLLDAGAEPNFCNQNNDTLVHVAARLGSLEIIKLLYETGKCNLELRNNDNLNALQIANGKLNDRDFFVTKLFRHYDASVPVETDDIHTMKARRRECSIYLSSKMAFDGIGHVERVLDNTVEYNTSRHKARSIIRGTCNNHTDFISQIAYPTDEKLVSAEDRQFIENYSVGMEYITQKVFTSDFVEKSVKVGFNNALDGR